MSTDATGQTYHVVQLRGLGNVPLYPAIQKAEAINLLTAASSLPPTTKAVVDYVLQAVQEGGGGGATNLADLQDVSITLSSAERQLLTGDGATWSNSLKVGDTCEQEVLYPTEFMFEHNTVQYLVKRYPGGVYHDKWSDFRLTNIVFDPVAKQISSLTCYNKLYGAICRLTLVDAAAGYYTGTYNDIGMTCDVYIRDIKMAEVNYSSDVVPTLTGVRDVFDPEYFSILDDKRVIPKLAPMALNLDESYEGYGVAAFYYMDFIVENGVVRLNTDTGFTDYVIAFERYSDGSWARLWKSGWLLQGGAIECTVQANTTVTFPMEFATTEYNIQYTMSRANLTSTDTAQIRFCAVSNLTTTSFDVRAVVSADQGHKWYACGQAAW